MRFLIAYFILCAGLIGAQPAGLFNRPMGGGAINQPSPIAAGNNPFTGFGLNQLNNPGAAAGFPMNQQPVLSGLNALNNPLAQQGFPQQTLPQQNLMQQPIFGNPQVGGLNAIGLADQQIQQLALQAAQPTMNQWLSNDFQSIFQRAGALNTPSLTQPIMGGGAPLQGVQALQGMPNTLAALQQQMAQPLTQNLLQSNPNLAQWLQQQQLAMQQAVQGPAAAAAAGGAQQQFPIPGNSPVGQFQVDQGPLTGPNPQSIMMPTMQSRPSPQSQQTLPTMNLNQPILQGSPLGQPQQFNAPNINLQDFTLSAPQQLQANQGSGGPQMQQPLPQPNINLNQPSAPSQINPAGPQGMPNINNPNMNAPNMNAPRPRP